MRKIILFLFFVFVFAFILTSEVSAQVVINEIEPYAEWVELYKTQEGEVLLEGCVIYFHNSTGSYQKKEFGTENKFLEQEFFKKIDTGSTWLANDGDTVILDCDWGQDTLSYGQGAMVNKPPTNKSIGRYLDGSNNFYVLDVSTPGASNSYTQPTPTLSPTPVPTSVPSPTSTPTPTSVPTVKPTVKAAATKRPTPTARPAVKKDENDDKENILGLRDELMASPLPESEEEVKKKFPFMAGLFLVGGIGLIGVAGFTFIKNKKKEYNKGSEKKRNDGFNKIEIKGNDSKKSS
jgi:hypothetical protein